MKTRQQKTPEARRADILCASERLFLEKGINATRIEDIAKAADIGKGTLYLYFRNKEDILVGLGQVFLNYFIERIEYHRSLCLKDGLCVQVHAWLNGCLDALYDKADLHHLVFHSGGHQPVKHHHANPAVKILQNILDEHKQVDTAFRAAIIFNIVHGGMEFAFSQKPVMTRSELSLKLIEQIDWAIK